MVKTRSAARLSSTTSSDGESSKGFYDNLPPDKIEKSHKKKRGRKATKTKETKQVVNIPVRPAAVVNPTTAAAAASSTTMTPIASVAPVSVINYPTATTVTPILQPTVTLTHHPYLQMINPAPPVAPPHVPVITSQGPQARTVHQWLMSQASRNDSVLENIPLSRVAELEQASATNYMNNTMKVGHNRYPVHPDVKFKRLPFYQELAELMKPSTLVPKTESGVQENTFYFHLTPLQTQLIMNAPEANVMQAQLRFCKVETSCEQDDCFPPSIGVKINNRVCPLPMPIPTNKCYVEPKRPPGPVNITSLLKLSPTVANQIVITWMNDFMTRYAITVTFVKKLTPSNLLSKLKNKGTKNPDYTRSLIKEKLREDLDCEIATTSLRVSLVCPLGKMRMLCPCRPLTCIHLQCFDASFFLAMNEKKPSWVCPVCDKAALYDNLVVDGYFLEVLSSARLAPDCTEIQLHKDGSWSAHVKTDIVPQQVFNDVEVIPDDDVIPLSDGSDSSTGLPSLKRGAGSRDGFPDQPSPRPPPSNASNSSSTVMVGSTTVDLTSDSDDDLPLRRKVPKKHQQAEANSSKDTDNDKNVGKKNHRHSSLDLAVSSIISLDSPSPLTVPTSPNGNSSEATMIVDALDPIMDLDAETTEALKQISTNEQTIDLETPERVSSPSSPSEASENSPDSPKAKENSTDDPQEEDPIDVAANPKESAENEDDTGDSPTKSARSGVATPERMPIDALEKLIDIANTSETNEAEMPDPLEIEESICNVPAASETFDDGSNHRIDFVKDPIHDVLGKDNQFFTPTDDIAGDSLRSENGEASVKDPEEVPHAVVSPFNINAEAKAQEDGEVESEKKRETASTNDKVNAKDDGEDEADKDSDSDDDSDESDSKADDTDKETDSDHDVEEEEEEEEEEPETIVDTIP